MGELYGKIFGKQGPCSARVSAKLFAKAKTQNALDFQGFALCFLPRWQRKMFGKKKRTHNFQPLDRGPDMTISVGRGQRVATLCPGLKREIEMGR